MVVCEGRQGFSLQVCVVVALVVALVANEDKIMCTALFKIDGVLAESHEYLPG